MSSSVNLHEENVVAEEPSQGEPHRPFTTREIGIVTHAAELICQRRKLTLFELSVLSTAWAFMAYRELAECKGQFYELVCDVNSRKN